MRLLRRSERTPRPWKNGLGVSHDVLVGEAQDTGADAPWLISIATVSGDVAFSRYDDADRALMPLHPAGLDLVIEGESVHVPQYAVLDFSGERSISVEHLSEPREDLGVIVDRRHASGSLVRLDVDGHLSVEPGGPGETVVAVVLSSTLRCGVARLRPGDAVLLDEADAVTFEGTGAIAVARVRPRNPRAQR
ncbi:HutD/Ves family protein [Microbacterium gorillae]|uniref:HutD/Ves family protein n=1 Tax=Microbacterium gorillae TaxID=1231063 RepID=UPI0006934902|nr:HutD family protein [Microbacterium gorillae]